ncbi:MAG: AMIN domain-containing protein, partial [Myxococcota bacterium]
MRFGKLAVVACLLMPGVVAAQELNTISKVEVSGEGDKATVLVTGSRRPTFQAYQQKAPVRVVVDLVKSRLSNVPAKTAPEGNTVVKEIHASQMGGAGRELTRIEIVFHDDVDYQVDADGNALRLTATRRAKPAQPLVAEEEKKKAEEAKAAELAKAEAEKKAKEEAEKL